MSRKSSFRRSWLDQVVGLFTADRRGPAPRGRGRRRSLRFESLEGRTLLSATVLPSISGTVFHDLTQNGLTADDPRLPGITVNLYRDGGNGFFDGSDQLIGSYLTDNANGAYHFNNLNVGTYFVQQLTAPGLAIPSAQQVRTVNITANDLKGVTGVVIDSFDTTSQSVAATRLSKEGASTMAAPEAIGGYRDLYAKLTTSVGSLGLGANANVPGVLDFASGSASNGLYWATWDGPGGDPKVLNPTGLNHADLTGQGAGTGIKFTLGADHDNAFAVLKVYTDANNWSWANVTIPNTGDGTANQETVVPFSSFSTGGGTGADFSNVGAVRFELSGVNAVDGQSGPITAIGPKVFAQDFANISQTDLAILKTNAPNPVTAGTQLTYSLQITNSGPSGATGVVVTDPLPAGVTYASASTSQGSATASNGTVTLSLGSLASGGSATATIIVTVAPGTTGTLTNTATVTGNEPDPNLANNKSTALTQVNSLIDLVVAKTGTPDPVRAGKQVTYTITTTNAGPSNATGVVAVDTLPAAVTYVSATSSQGTAAAANGVVTISLGNLAVGASATTTIVATVNDGTTNPITNTVVVSGHETETNLANNTASVTTQIDIPIIPHGDPEIDLAIVKTAAPNPVQVGSNLVYTLLVTNNSTTTATGVTVVDTLPGGVSYVTASATQGSVSRTGGVVRVSLGQLVSHASATITLVVAPTASAVGYITNRATVTGNEPETHLSDNESSVVTLVYAPLTKRRFLGR